MCPHRGGKLHVARHKSCQENLHLLEDQVHLACGKIDGFLNSSALVFG